VIIGISCGVVTIVAVLAFASSNQLALLGAVIAGLLGFFYFVQQQKLAEIALFKELFTEFNERYSHLYDCLSEITQLQNQVSPQLSQSSEAVIIEYFNLCAEEYLFYKEGYIHDEAWSAWKAGMRFYFDNEVIKALWDKEKETESYYELSEVFK